MCERRESNLEPQGEKQECSLCAMQPLHQSYFCATSVKFYEYYADQLLKCDWPDQKVFSFYIAAKLSDPEFETVSETIVNRQSPFRKVEYTIKLEVDGKTFYGSAHTKKNAKAAVATEAWNIIRTGTM